jgi:hypothetical protein
MTLRFDPASFARAVILFAILILLATFGRNLGWIRSFLGDVLAVAWVFYAIRTVIKANAALIALLAFVVGAVVEFAQYILTSMDVQIPNPILRVVFGATPDWWDVLAYAIGAMLVLAVDAMERTVTQGKA